MENYQYYRDKLDDPRFIEEMFTEFEWTDPYKISDKDLPIVEFPNCSIAIWDNGVSGIELHVTKYKGKHVYYSLDLLLSVINVDSKNTNLPSGKIAWPNLEAMKTCVRNIITIFQAYCLPLIKGEDDKWIEETKKQYYLNKLNNGQFLTEEFFETNLVEKIMAEFQWPDTYEIIDHDFSAEIIFPNCSFDIMDNGEGGVSVDFVTYKKREINISLAIFLWVRNLRTKPLNLPERKDVWPNLEDMKRSIKNSMTVLQAYCLPLIKGEDDKWVEDAHNPELQ